MLGLHCFFLILMSSLVSLFSFVFSWLLSSIYMFYCLAFWREAVVSTSWFSFFCGWRFEFCSSVVHVCFCQFFVVWLCVVCFSVCVLWGIFVLFLHQCVPWWHRDWIVVVVLQMRHKQGVMHRDLKPENFLFANKKETAALKAIDFRLSVFFKPGNTFSWWSNRWVLIVIFTFN